MPPPAAYSNGPTDLALAVLAASHGQHQNSTRMFADVASHMFGGGSGGFRGGGGWSGSRLLTAGDGMLAQGFSNVGIAAQQLDKAAQAAANHRERSQKSYYFNKNKRALVMTPETVVSADEKKVRGDDEAENLEDEF